MTEQNNVASASDIHILKEKGFHLEKVIGEGSYAKVYKSLYKNENKQCYLACKCIDVSKAPKEYQTKFLPRELDILIRTNHPHIVHIAGIFQRKTKYFVFLRFAENGDLLDLITSSGGVSEDQSRLWMRQLCLALEYLHAMNICHRDLKCENVLITSNYNAKLTDFGFGRVIRDDEDLSQTYCGSLSYAAPEVLKGSPYGPKMADMWSMGIVLYTMINKALPFNETSVKKMYEKQITKKWKFRSTVVNTLSKECKDLIVYLLDPEPFNRPTATKVIKGTWISLDDTLRKMTFMEEQSLKMAKEEASKPYDQNQTLLDELRKSQRGKDGLKTLKAALTDFATSTEALNAPKARPKPKRVADITP